MKRKKGRATPVQSPAVNAALPTPRGGGPAYRGRGRHFWWGLCECWPPLAPRDETGAEGAFLGERDGQGKSLL